MWKMVFCIDFGCKIKIFVLSEKLMVFACNEIVMGDA